MAQPGEIREREHSKFVESPSRPGNSAVEVVGTFSDAGSVAANPTIVNQNLVISGQEYLIAIPANCVGIYLRARSLARLKLAFILNDTNSNYFTIPLGGVFNLERKITSSNIYVQSDKVNTEIEILFLTT